MAYGDIVKTFSSAPRTVITMDTDDVKVMCTVIDGHEYRFNSEWIPPESLEWVAWVFESHLVDCHKRAVEKTKSDIRTEYFKFLNIFGGC